MTALNQEPAMWKRNVSLQSSREHQALPVLPAQSRALVKPNCWFTPLPLWSTDPQPTVVDVSVASPGALRSARGRNLICMW